MGGKCYISVYPTASEASSGGMNYDLLKNLPVYVCMCVCHFYVPNYLLISWTHHYQMSFMSSGVKIGVYSSKNITFGKN